MTQKIRDKIAELTKNLTPDSDLILISKAESEPQTGPGKTVAWRGAKSKLESVRKQREVALEIV